MKRISFGLLASMLILLFSCKKDKQNPSTQAANYQEVGSYAYAVGVNKAADFISLPYASGYLLLGSYQDYNSTDVFYYLTKIDTGGTVIWSNVYGDTGTVHQPQKLVLTSSGNVIILGNRIGAIAEIELIKVDPSGNQLQSNTFSEEQNQSWWVQHGAINNNGQLIITGITEYTGLKPYAGTWEEQEDKNDGFHLLIDPQNLTEIALSKKRRGYSGTENSIGVFPTTEDVIYATNHNRINGNATANNITYDRIFGLTAFNSNSNSNIEEYARISGAYSNLEGDASAYNSYNKQLLCVGNDGQQLILQRLDFNTGSLPPSSMAASSFSGNLNAVSATLLSNGNYLITSVLENGTDVNVHKFIVDNQLAILSQTTTGEANETERPVKGLAANGLQLFLAEETNSATQAPAAFVNEPDTIVLGIFN